MIIYKLGIYDQWDNDGDNSFTVGYFSTKEKAEIRAKEELKTYRTYYGKYKTYIEEIELDTKV